MKNSRLAHGKFNIQNRIFNNERVLTTLCPQNMTNSISSLCDCGSSRRTAYSCVWGHLGVSLGASCRGKLWLVCRCSERNFPWSASDCRVCSCSSAFSPQRSLVSCCAARGSPRATSSANVAACPSPPAPPSRADPRAKFCPSTWSNCCSWCSSIFGPWSWTLGGAPDFVTISRALVAAIL